MSNPTISAFPARSKLSRDSRSRRNATRLLTRLVLVALAGAAAPAWAQTVPLGAASSFSVLGASAVTNTGPTVLGADLGISPNNATSVTGFPPGIVLGATHFADAVALQAQNDLTAAFTTITTQRPCGTTISADLGGTTLAPGVYCTPPATSIGLTGTLTLDAQGDPNAVFIFKVGSTLTTASASRILLINGGSSCNIFFQIGSSATLGTGTSFLGNILAQDSITVTTGAGTNGRLLARTAAVTLDTSTVSVCGAVVGAPNFASTRIVPTLSQWALLLLGALLAPLGIVAIRRQSI